jgi:hypothetical protein
MEDQVVKPEIKRFCFIKQQAVIAVLLFLCLGESAWAGVAEDIAAGKELQEVIQTSLDAEKQLEDIIADLDAAGVPGSVIICALFEAQQPDHAMVIAAALNAGLSVTDVAGWAYTCGAVLSEIQVGYSMVGDNLPAHMVFSTAGQYERNAGEFLYNPPSPSK